METVAALHPKIGYGTVNSKDELITQIPSGNFITMSERVEGSEIHSLKDANARLVSVYSRRLGSASPVSTQHIIELVGPTPSGLLTPECCSKEEWAVVKRKIGAFYGWRKDYYTDVTPK